MNALIAQGPKPGNIIYLQWRLALVGVEIRVGANLFQCVLYVNLQYTVAYLPSLFPGIY